MRSTDWLGNPDDAVAFAKLQVAKLQVPTYKSANSERDHTPDHLPWYVCLAMTKTQTLRLGRRSLELSNLEKVFFPKVGFRKGDVIGYYKEVAPILLPHLKDRPLTLKRYPDGVTGSHFYEKDAPRYTPDWVKTYPVPRKEAKGKDAKIDYLLANDAASLLWTVNLANLEMHAFLAKVPRLERPTAVVFDLDPGAPADLLTCIDVALELRKLFERLELEAYPKVSGSKGLQLYLPLNTAVTYDVTRPFAETIARMMVERMPKLVVSNMSKSVRTGKVLIDWSQNDDFKTTVVAYSLRAKSELPYVSAPVEWDELVRARRSKDRSKLFFSPQEALRRIEKKGDLFEPVLELKQRLPKDFVEAAAEQTRSSKPPTGARKRTDMAAYKAKRDFEKTAEPPPRVLRKSSGKLRFVIQKHAASHLHYDFRLEMEGVLRSWAVPKGPSTTKGERRLAMHVEDHPLDYADFEGTIPSGNYGAGTVMVWDRGTYTVEGDPAKNFRQGKLHLNLVGEKLKGEWALVKTGDDNKWFLIKVGEDAKPISKARDDRSVVSKRSMSQIAKDRRSKTWQSNRS